MVQNISKYHMDHMTCCHIIEIHPKWHNCCQINVRHILMLYKLCYIISCIIELSDEYTVKYSAIWKFNFNHSGGRWDLQFVWVQLSCNLQLWLVFRVMLYQFEGSASRGPYLYDKTEDMAVITNRSQISVHRFEPRTPRKIL